MKWIPLLALVIAPLAYAQTYSGTLDNNDSTRDNGTRFDEYTFQAQENQRVTVRMTGIDFDTYLVVQPPNDLPAYENDDFEGVSVSQVEFIARTSGLFTIQASAYSETNLGDYTVEVTLGGIANIDVTEGRLVPGDSQALKGEFYDEHSVRGAARGEIAFELLSYGFDGFLVVRSPTGETFRNDDAMGGPYNGRVMTSRIESMQDQIGTWTVFVTSLGEGEVGAYDLRVIRSNH